MNECQCDLEFSCGSHEDEQVYWAGVIGLKPHPYIPTRAYDADDYKGRHYEGWDAA